MRLLSDHASDCGEVSARGRVFAYRQALGRESNGRVVCQIGLGRLPLWLMALRSGASRVYCIDADRQALGAAQVLARAQGFGNDQFHPLPGLINEVSPPERFDIIVSEPFQHLGLQSHIGRTLSYARRYLLKPGGIFIPSRVTCFAALASPKTWRQYLDSQRDQLAGLMGLKPGELDGSMRSPTRLLSVEEGALYSDWHPWRHVEFLDPSSYRQAMPIVFSASRSGVVEGVACRYEAELTRGIRLHSRPLHKLTSFHQAFRPFSSSMDVWEGDHIYLEMLASEQQVLDLDFETRVLGWTGMPAMPSGSAA